jgi:hypothetical protein
MGESMRTFLVVDCPDLENINRLLECDCDATVKFGLVDLKDRSYSGVLYLEFREDTWVHSLESGKVYIMKAPVFEKNGNNYVETGVLSGWYNLKYQIGLAWRFD